MCELTLTWWVFFPFTLQRIDEEFGSDKNIFWLDCADCGSVRNVSASVHAFLFKTGVLHALLEIPVIGDLRTWFDPSHWPIRLTTKSVHQSYDSRFHFNHPEIFFICVKLKCLGSDDNGIRTTSLPRLYVNIMDEVSLLALSDRIPITKQHPPR